MARGKKRGSTQTVEERLAEALVPEEEQPYRVPDNWCWTTLGHAATWGSGGTPSRKKPEYYLGDIPWVKTGELNDDYIYETTECITTEAVINSSAKLFPVNTIVIAMYGATIGKVGILGVEAATNQACACAIVTSAIHYKYLFHYARSQKDTFIAKGKGGAQPNISQEIIKKHSIPIPPVAEQHRIVNRIESLFAKLDEAKEKAQSVLDGFETRKAAILHKAFTGELTAKWRAERGVSAFYKMEKFGEITSEVRLGLVKGKVDQAYDKQYPYLKMNNITLDGRVDIEDLVWVDASEDEVKTYALREGDFLFNTRNSFELVGKNTVWNGEKSGVVLFNNNIMRVRFSSQINPRYVSFFFNSSEGKAQLDKCKKNTTNIAAIYAKNLNEIGVSIVSIEEQMEIVRILDSLFAKEQQAKGVAEAVLEQIDIMKKSILARAFRGELGTNDPTEESAVELLKSVLA